MQSIDASLLDLFRAELETHLPSLSEGLLALEKEPVQPKRLEALMRASHSIKGAAKIVSVDAAVRVAHAMEDCFVAAQNGRVHLGSDAVDVLLRGVDALNRVAPGGEERTEMSEKELTELVETIAAIQTGNRAPAVQPDASTIAPNVTHSVAVPASAVSDRLKPELQPKRPVASDAAIRPDGDLDKTRAEAIRAELSNLLRQGVSPIQLDFAAVDDVDATGLALLAQAARAAGRFRPRISFRVRNASPRVQRILRLTRLEESFPTEAEGA
jgi:two-component system sensor histidine kinase and response regulator WspE